MRAQRTQRGQRTQHGRRRDSFREPLARRGPFPLRTTVRLATRLAFARRGRAALVMALVAVPIMGVAAGAVLIQSTIPTTTETLDLDLGHAAARMTTNGPDLAGFTQDPVQWQSGGRVAAGSPLSRSGDAEPHYADLRDHVPDGTRGIEISQQTVQLDGPKGPVGLPTTVGAAWDPALEGHWRVLSGRTPRTAGEAMVTPATLERLGASVGDSFTTTGSAPTRLTIVGTIRDRNEDDAEQGLYVRRGAVPDPQASTAGGLLGNDRMVYLPSASLDWSAVRALNAHGIVVESRQVVLDPPPVHVDHRGVSQATRLYGFLAALGVFALFEVGLLAAAAFLVSSRADTRTHAVVASVGGDRRMLFATVSGSGVVLGAVGAVVGTVVGAGAGTIAYHVMDNGSRAQYPALHVPLLALVVVAFGGVVAGWFASLVAARSASRVDVLAALRGSGRPATRPRRRAAVVAGPVLVAVGAVMTLACGVLVLLLNDRPVQGDTHAIVAGAGVAVGPCLAQLGMVLWAPSLLGWVARLAGRWGLAARMAARDAVRNPVRTVPVLASVMSVVFVATVAATFTVATQVQSRDSYTYQSAVGVAMSPVTDGTGQLDAALTARAASVMRRVFPDHPVRVLAQLPEGSIDGPAVFPRERAGSGGAVSPWNSEYGSGAPRTLIGSESDLAELMGRTPSAAARASLAAGDAVALWPSFVQDGEVRFDSWRADDATTAATDPEAVDPISSVRVPAVVDVPEPHISVGVFMTSAGAAAHGLDTTPGLLMTRMDAQPTPQEQDDMSAAWASAGGDQDGWSPYWQVETGPQDFAAALLAFVVAVAAAVTLAATWVAVGLARADARRDDEVLDAVGAPPRLRRSVATWQAALLTAVGSVIGVGLGLLPLRALTLRFTEPPAGTSHMPFVVDPLVLGLLLVGLPLVVTAGVWLTSGGRRRIAVRRAA